MAPEVGLHLSYNLKADVYSWVCCICTFAKNLIHLTALTNAILPQAMIVWYILALEPPMAAYSRNMIEERVFRRGYRPKVFSRWSSRVSDLIKQAWDADHRTRPTMKDAANVIRTELGAINPRFAILIENTR